MQSGIVGNRETASHGQQAAALYAALQMLKRQGPRRKGEGACGNLNALLVHGVWLERYYSDWPLRKPHPVYPVEGGSSAYDANTRKWDIHTDFGMLRWAMVEHMIEECERVMYEIC